jgi:cyclohexanecarboxylate-CoA ligase
MTRQQRTAAEWKRRGLWTGDTIPGTLRRTAERLPDKTAVVDDEQRLTFADLAQRSQALAGGLRGLGLRPGDSVAYQLPNWWETVVVAHAIAALGAIATPVAPTHGRREVGFILRESGARALFVPDRFRGTDHGTIARSLQEDLDRLEHIVVVRGAPEHDALAFADLEKGTDAPGTGMPAEGAAGAPSPFERADDVAFLIYTSGTTADPKGVLHTHNTLLAEARSLEAVHALSAMDTVLMPLPLTHISGIIHAVLVPAALGTTAVLMDRWEPAAAIRLIGRERVTYMVGPPIFLRDLCRNISAPIEGFRLFSCGGADVTPDVISAAEAQLGCVAKRVYGSTEFPTLTTTAPSDPQAKRRETDGRVIGAAELRILDRQGHPCAPGTEGEIVARGPECCVGYRNPALDAEGFDAEGWFRTGDLGIVDRSGYLRITGRKKDIIIRKGENISAREVEALLAEHPDVDEVAVVGIPDPETGERACAVVRPRAGVTPTLEQLTRFLRERGLSTRKLPERLSIVTEFPRTASGKIRKAALRERILPEHRLDG